MADKVIHSVSDVKRQKILKRPYPRVSKRFELPTRTRGSETPSTDLQMIVNRYRQIGSLPPSQLQYGDVSEMPASRLEAMQIIEQAAAAFLDLPLKVRQAVDHDPRKLDQWIAGNPQLAQEYGLFKPVPKSSSPENPSSSADAGEGKSGSDA